MRFLVVVVVSSLLLILAGAQPYSHQRLGVNFYDIGNGVLSAAGLPAWSASLSVSPTTFDIYRNTGNQNFSAAILGSGNRLARPAAIDANGRLLWEGQGSATGFFLDVFVETSNISQSVLGSSREAFAFRFAPNGNPIWVGAGSNTSNQYDIFIGTTNLTASVLGSSRTAWPVDLNSTALLWDGFGSGTGGYRDAFKTLLSNFNSANLSQSILGAGSREARAVDLNEAGNALWEGYGTSTGNFNDVFLDSTNISRSVLGTGTRTASASMVNANGNVIWRGLSSVTNNYFDVFRDSTNLSQGVLGTGEREAIPATPVPLNSAAHALWEGYSTNTGFYFDVFLTIGSSSTNLSRGTLGSGARDSVGLWLDGNGNALWLGRSGSATSDLYNLFYYDRNSSANTNLTQSAVGSSQETVPLAINEAGQVLWAALDPNDQLWDIWLSTPRLSTVLRGTATLQGFVGDPTQVVLQVQLIDPLTGNVVQTSNVNLQSNRTYQVTVNNPGYYIVRMKAPRFLQRRFSERRILGDTVLDVSFINGDVNGDNVINDTDLSSVLSLYGSATSDPVDLNGDGVVTDADLSIVLGNYGLTGES